MLSGRRILVTGGTGFLGRGILRHRKANNWSSEITVLSRDEYKQDLCKRKYPDVNYVLGDVRDENRLQLVMTGHDIIIHTAAIKYIPEAEFNVAECIDVNVGGSRNVIDAARRSGVTSVICISTDKVVQPVNTYGMTKALMERLVGEASRYDGPFYAACRYGNVVGSTGSVIPLFQRQMKEQGYITVTDPTMTRYYIGIDEAVELILSCFTMQNGSIRVPTPRAMNTFALARAIADNDADKIQYIGKRPGEKLHEQMMTSDEQQRSTFDLDTNLFELYPATSSFLNPLNSFCADMTSSKAEPITIEDMQELIEDSINV